MTADHNARSRWWLAAVAAALIAGAASLWVARSSPAAAGLATVGRQWFGVYLEERKIGHAWLEIRESRNGEPRSIVAETSMAVKLAGGDRRLEIDAARYYRRRPPHRLIEVRVHERSADGTSDSRETGPSDETLETFTTQYLLEPASVEVGDRFELAELDVDSGRDRAVTVAVAAKRTQLYFGVRTEVVELAIRRSGDRVETRTVIAAGSDSPITLRAVVGPFSFRAQDQRAARSAIEGLDPLSGVVPVDRALGDPARIRALEVALASSADFEVPAAAGQVATREASGRIRVAIDTGPGPPVSAAGRAAALRATAAIDHRDPAIAALARELASPDRRVAVARMVAWVHDNLSKQPSTNLSSASQVLAARVGDCTEHTALFVALARAAGIPAREVSGLVYGGDEIGGFAWHAWAEVEIDGRWRRVDPSWGEASGNAAHLALGVGGSSDWLALLGDLEIEVLRVSAGSGESLQ